MSSMRRRKNKEIEISGNLSYMTRNKAAIMIPNQVTLANTRLKYKEYNFAIIRTGQNDNQFPSVYSYELLSPKLVESLQKIKKENKKSEQIIHQRVKKQQSRLQNLWNDSGKSVLGVLALLITTPSTTQQPNLHDKTT